jgi:type I restriction enzyme S subunit
MGLINIRLGDYIERSTINNKDLKYEGDLIVGVNSQGVFATPKGNTDGVDLKPYKIVENGAFVYNPTRLELGSIAYRTEGLCIVSHLYMVFYLTDEGKKIIDPMWLYIYFRRSEFCREVTFRNFGSQRPEFNFNDMSDIIIPLPDIEIQKKYVDVYNAMIENQKSYERGLDDLKLICDAYIEDLRRKLPCDIIGNYVHQYNEKNNSGEIILEQGININKRFINPQRTNDNFYGRKIVRTGQIAYCTQLNNENIAVALRTGPDCIVSNVYDVIEFNENSGLIPEYLMLWLVRAEFGRFVYWASQGTSYEFLAYDNLANYKIPVPDYEVQKSIVGIYNVYNERREINEKLKAQIKDICPILIKGSIEEARKAKEA